MPPNYSRLVVASFGCSEAAIGEEGVVFSRSKDREREKND